MNYSDKYQKLTQNRKMLDLNILLNYKRNTWKYFRRLTSVSNLEKNMSKNFYLYLAPVNAINGSNMVCWPVSNNVDIYLDYNFAKENPYITTLQLQHEILHGLCGIRDEHQYFFGHKYDGSGKSNYTGLDEATTQMFSEDITGIRLKSEEDYLYFLKNVIRVIKVLFGTNNLAAQYLNNNNELEKQINEITDYKFDAFAIRVNELYNLSKINRYGTLSYNQKIEYETKKENIIKFIRNLIKLYQVKDNAIVEKIICEFGEDKYIQNVFGLSNIKSIEHDNYKIM